MRIPRPIRTLIPALLLAAAFTPATTRGGDSEGWRATRRSQRKVRSDRLEPVVEKALVTDDGLRGRPAEAGHYERTDSVSANRTTNIRDADIRPITFIPHQQPPVSTWSRIRRAAAETSPYGIEWASPVRSDRLQPDVELVALADDDRRGRPAEAGHYEPPPVWTDVDDAGESAYTWQVLPAGLLYKSYMAGSKEPRLGTAGLHNVGGDTIQSSTLGARVGIIRFGTPRAIRPEGWELDFAGAAFLRQNWDHDLDVDAVDFRYGVPLTWRRGPMAAKFGFYHLSSHAGDEFLIRTPDFQRRNYARDALLLGVSYNVTPDWRVYGEVGYSFHTDGGAEPWEFQFGAEYSPIVRNGWRGSPFFAINGHLRQEFDFGGALNVMFGWQWRSDVSDHVFRLGGQYYNGKSLQFEFFNQNEQLIGAGVWYDF